LWTGPLLLGWLLSVALAPNSDFIVHSFSPLLRALWFNGIALVALAAIALGVSALCRKSAIAVSVWIGLWLVLWVVALPPPGPLWLKRASFARDIAQVQRGVFQLDAALITAADALPITDKGFVRSLRNAGNWLRPDDFNGALWSLGAFVALSSVVFLRRLRPE
jgi:ABC-2 type transport system permease protein